MFVIRQAHPSDVSTLLKMARSVYFINLPPDRDVISEKVRSSRASFAVARGGASHVKPRGGSANGRSQSAAGESPSFMFVLEDTESGAIAGTSAVVAEMGTPGNPNVSLQLRRREFFSTDLQTGATHVTAKLVLDEDGPTELGGLIVAPGYRGHKQKLGKQLSLIRFHYIGLHRNAFKDRLLAEMMAPITPDGQNTLWEYFGRRFINLSYQEADRFCAHSREFMTSLLPREEIFLTLLPPEARALIGQVGPDTIPARRMLEKLGFVYRDRIDPFDGGPHIECETQNVNLVRDTKSVEFSGVCAASDAKSVAFVSYEGGSDNAEFRALQCNYRFAGDAEDAIQLSKATAKALGVEEGASLGFTPLEAPQKREKSDESSRRGKKKTAQ